MTPDDADLENLRMAHDLFGIALIVGPWFVDGGSTLANRVEVIAGLALIALAVPRGRIANSYGSRDRFLT